jgi:hypothetical protein
MRCIGGRRAAPAVGAEVQLLHLHSALCIVRDTDGKLVMFSHVSSMQYYSPGLPGIGTTNSHRLAPR